MIGENSPRTQGRKGLLSIDFIDLQFAMDFAIN